MRPKILKIFFLIFCFVSFAAMISPVSAQQKKLNVYFFESDICPHCRQEKTFLGEMEKKYGESLRVYGFEIGNKDNLLLLQKIDNQLSVDISSVPFTIIGDQAISGYYNDETTGVLIERTISDCLLKTDCPDLVGEFITVEKLNSSGQKPQKIPEKIKVPFFGELSVKNLSLPILTVILGGIDGFNPCAMWVLVFLISFLIGVKDKKRTWILGSVFIAASAAVYFLFMSAWLNLFLFLGFIFWIRIVIGLVALISGGYSLREFFVNKEAVCKVISGGTKQKLLRKLKDVVEKRRLLLALIGIIAIAFAVNLIELVCSAGLPAVYTQILTLSRLSQWQYYLYLLFYVFIFMLDDLIVFFAAMLTLQLIGATAKYTRVSRLVGGIILLIVGVLLILRPEFLMFG